MKGYLTLGVSILVNLIICLGVATLFKFELHEVLAAYAFIGTLICNINIRMLVEATKADLK